MARDLLILLLLLYNIIIIIIITIIIIIIVVNIIRSQLAARMIGNGRDGMDTFSGIMGMPPPITRLHFVPHTEKIV